MPCFLRYLHHATAKTKKVIMFDVGANMQKLVLRKLKRSVVWDSDMTETDVAGIASEIGAGPLHPCFFLSVFCWGFIGE